MRDPKGNEALDTKMPTDFVRQASIIKLIAATGFILSRLGD